MDDVLDLEVEGNEFEEESPAKSCEMTGNFKPREFGGKNFGANTDFPLNSNDYILLCEAKKRLLDRLEKLEKDSSKIKVEKPSVKSRLGTVRENVEDLEFMECTESTACVSGLSERCQSAGNRTSSTSETFPTSTSGRDDIPRRPSMKILCKRLRVRWCDDPVRIGKQIAERLQESLFGMNFILPYTTKILMTEQVKDCKLLPFIVDGTVAVNEDCWLPFTVDGIVAVNRLLAVFVNRDCKHKHDLIINTVKTLGGKKVLELFNETKRIQMEGGMKTSNGSRRRTSGGVFFTLLKNNNYATKEEVKNIFKEDVKIKTEAVKRKRAMQRQKRRQRKKLEEQKMEENSTVES